MHIKRLLIRLRAVFLVLAAGLFLPSVWAADHQTVLYNFGPPPDGAYPVGSLTKDAAGNLYGATYIGGIYCALHDCGTVFELSRTQGGGWMETVLYNFGNGNDANSPNGSLIMDAAGNLYGTTFYGGTYNYGTVFELSPNGGGGWTEAVLHSFSLGTDGGSPYQGGLIIDAAGNLYGIANGGGIYGKGIVFELSPSQNGVWTETVLYNFGQGTDAAYPEGKLIADAVGNLYGTTRGGGQGGSYCQSGCGTVFELSPGMGGWTETVIHSFTGDDGTQPTAGVVMDGTGNLYGTAVQGGNLVGLLCAPFGCGTVFELSPVAGGGWTETTLYSFNGQPDGAGPDTGVILDAAGNLYGTTLGGGNENGGMVFEISPRQGGWTETVLYSFDQITSGGLPTGGLITDRAGDLYGVTGGGGTYDAGLVYELTPPSICAHCVPTEH